MPCIRCLKTDSLSSFLSPKLCSIPPCFNSPLLTPDSIWCFSVGVRRRNWLLKFSNPSSLTSNSLEIKSLKAVTLFLFPS
ncbi:unnamed protein product [Thlaspi arvense]|uniref:Uncharacterized protein n=1 Tax=Thlaspi arvense TaxID=13288 RepID=A0AAU9SDK1_THLAR|nr:unnamed protein product [Thlaspi arvense]